MKSDLVSSPPGIILLKARWLGEGSIVGVNTLGIPGWIGFIVAKTSPAKMKIIGNNISITSVRGSLI